MYAGVIFIAGKFIGYSSEQFSMLWILVLNQFLASFILYFRTNISGLQYFRTDSLLSVMDRTLMILFTGLLLWGNITNEPFPTLCISFLVLLRIRPRRCRLKPPPLINLGCYSRLPPKSFDVGIGVDLLAHHQLG